MNEVTQFESANDEIEIDLRELFHVVMGRIVPIVGCFFAGIAIAVLITKLLITPLYSSASQLFILTKTTTVTSLADIQMGAQLTVDFETLAKSRPVIEGVIEELGLDMNYDELKEIVTTENPADTRILKLLVDHPDPETACDIANTLADITADQVANVMDTDKPNVVERAVVAENASSPNLIKNAAIGGMIGLLLALAVVVLRFITDDTIQTEEDVRKYLNLNVLAAVPIERD